MNCLILQRQPRDEVGQFETLGAQIRKITFIGTNQRDRCLASRDATFKGPGQAQHKRAEHSARPHGKIIPCLMESHLERCRYNGWYEAEYEEMTVRRAFGGLQNGLLGQPSERGDG